MAMAGRNSVVIATDTRLGKNGITTVDFNYEKAFSITDKTIVGLTGLATDIQFTHKNLKFYSNLYSLREDREMKPRTVASFLSWMLYKKRFNP